MKESIELTKDGGFYYRAVAYHYAVICIVIIPLLILVALAIINPFWFRDSFMNWIEAKVNAISRYRDKVKYKIYLGTDPEVWHALKDK